MGEDCHLHDITNCGLAIGPDKAAGLGRFVDGFYHVLVCFKGFIGFACRKECLAAFLMCGEEQGLEIPAEELDKTLSYEKHYVSIILTHYGQVVICSMNDF
jgi:hypothetical protein